MDILQLIIAIDIMKKKSVMKNMKLFNYGVKCDRALQEIFE